MATGTVRPSTLPPPPPVPAGHVEHERVIQRQLGRTKMHVRLVDLASGLAVWIIGVIAFLFLAALADHWIGLGAFGRIGALAILAGGSLYFLALYVAPLLLRSINPTYAARTIEEATPTLKNSLVNFLLLKQDRQGLKEIVFQAVERQAASDIAVVPVDSAVDRSRLIHAGYVLCGVMAVFAAYKILSPKDPFRSVARVLAPWADIARPSRVQIGDVQPGSAEVYLGQTQAISAIVHGNREDETVRLVYTTADGQAVDRPVEMTLAAGGLRHECILPPPERGSSLPAGGLQQNISYRIVAGDAETSTYRLSVVSAPTIIVDRLHYEYPAYTKRPAEMVPQQGDIRALEGTKVTIHAIANQPIKSAWLDFDPATDDAPGERFQLTVADSRATGTITLMLKPDKQTPWHGSYQVRFYNERGQRSQQPILHKLDVIRDLAPEVQILEPQRLRVEVPEDSEQRIEVRGVDPDFGLSRLRIEGAVRGQPAVDVDLLPADSGQPPQATVSYALSPRALKLKGGDELLYSAVAEDNRTSPQTGQAEPNVARTKTYTLVVISPQAADPGKGGDNKQPPDGQQPPGPNQPPSGKQQPSDKPQPQKQQPGKAQQRETAAGQKQPMNDQGQGDQKQPPAAQNQEPQKNRPQQGGKNQNQQPQPDDQKQPGDQKQGDQKQGDQKQVDQKQGGQKQGDQKQDQGQQGQGQQGQQKQGEGQQGQGQQGQGQQGQGQGQEAQNQSQPGNQSGATGGQQQPGQSGGQPAGNPQQPGGQPGEPKGQAGGQPNGGGEKGPAHDGRAIEEVLREMEKRGERPQPGAGQPQGGQAQGGQAGQQQPGQQNADQQPGDAVNQPPDGQKGGPQNGKQQPGGQSAQTTPQPQSGGKSGGQAQNTPASGDPAASDQKADPAGQPERGQADRGQGKKGEGQQEAGQKAGEGNRLPDDQQGKTPSSAKSDGNKGGAPEGKSKTDKAGKPEPSEKTGGEKRDPGAAKNGDEGAGAASQDKSGSGAAQEANRDRPKEQEPGSNTPEKSDPGTPTDSKKQSDSKGAMEGDRSGGGKKGPGQPAKQKGNDSAGSQSAADQGAGEAGETGQGNQGDKAGNQQKGAGKTGQAGNEPGQGSTSRPNQGGKEGGPQSGDQRAAEQGPSKSADDASGKPASGEQGQPPAGQPPAGGQQGAAPPSQPQPGNPSGKPGDQGRGPGGSQRTGGGDGTGQASAQPPSEVTDSADAANLDYARKATEMVLQKLKDEEHNPDPELLDKLGWSRDDLAEFLRRWDALQKSAQENQDGKRELDEALKSLGLRDPNLKKRSGGQARDAQRDLRDAGNRSAPPARYRDLFDAFRKGAARSRE